MIVCVCGLSADKVEIDLDDPKVVKLLTEFLAEIESNPNIAEFAEEQYNLVMTEVKSSSVSVCSVVAQFATLF